MSSFQLQVFVPKASEIQPSSFKYNYIIKDPWSVRLTNIFGFFAFLCAIYGYGTFLTMNLWYLLIFTPFFLVLFVSKLFKYVVDSFYPEFKLKEHQEFINKFWMENPEPTVDIFLPVAGESIEILQKTWEGVKKIRYSNYKVYVLDDSYSDQVQKLAQDYNFIYLRRPNKGQHKKSGNLKFGYEQSNGEFVLVLDADFVPIPEALIESVPYIAKDKTISILQTPQYFDANKEMNATHPVEYGAASVVEEFYKVNMPSRARFGNAMCVGTSAIYRRAAIDEAGMPLVDHTEDVRQGLMTYSKGYHVSYIPVIISKGVCPNNLDSYTKQQTRWAYGSFETVFSHYFQKAKLDSWSKLNYLSSFMYYLSEAIVPIISLQLLCLLYFNTEELRLSWTIPFIPLMIYKVLIKPKFKLNKKLSGTRIVGVAHTYIYLIALIKFLLGKNLNWEITNGAIKANKKKEFSLVNFFAIGYSFVYTLLFVLIIFLKPEILLNFETYLILFYCLARIFDYLRFDYYLLAKEKTLK
jgi:cellulose synthase (UDP-forming)